jgi:DNA-binding transcriptional LysR family regulator
MDKIVPCEEQLGGRMQIEPNDLLMFARVAEAGSFSRAAERLGLPKSTVSRRIAELERELGERVMLRTTRKLTLTEFGHSLLHHARRLDEEVQSAMALAEHRQEAPSGRLRLSVPTDIESLGLVSLLAEYLQRHPLVSLDIDMSARMVDLIGENFDLAIRAGQLPDDANLVARRLVVQPFRLYASRDYLAAHGTPVEPPDLLKHTALTLRSRNGEPVPWQLTSGEQQWQGLPASRVTANSPLFLHRMVQAGLGIGCLPSFIVETGAGTGQLQPVMPLWCSPANALWAVFPGRRLMPTKTRALLDMLEARFAALPPL